MRRYLTLVCLLCLAIPAGISISGCTRNPGANYCNGLGYGLEITEPSSITLQPATTGISLAFGQTLQAQQPSVFNCKGNSAAVNKFTYGSTNSQLVDISPSGNICAGTWNRNLGGGIADYSICSYPKPLPSTGGLPYGSADISVTGGTVVSNPVTVHVHPPITSISLVTTPLSGTPQQCYSQGTKASLNSQACYLSNNKQYELCAPPSVTSASYTCSGGLPPGVSSVPDCTAAIGTLTYNVIASNVGAVVTNTTTNQVTITAEQPGTTAIAASLQGVGSSAGYFSTCPPKSISLTLANGNTSGTITPGVTQNLVTTVLDTNNNPITGMTLNYQSTDPIDISVSGSGAVTTNFPGLASVYAICQPATCNLAPINQIGTGGTGLPISSNPVSITTPGTATDYAWFSAPGQSQYFVSVGLLNGTVGNAVLLPYVPNSMVMDRQGTSLYFGSSRELMIASTGTNTITKQDTSVPGVVLAASPDAQKLLINDQLRQVFYIYNLAGGSPVSFGGLGNAAAWTPDSETLYITDNAALGGNHTDTLYIFNATTGWTTQGLPPSPLPPDSVPSVTTAPNLAALPPFQTPAITIPSVGAYLRGTPTVAHTWCPSGQVGDYTAGDPNALVFYPAPDSVTTQADVLTATTDGQHILGAAWNGGGITLSDIGVNILSEVLPNGMNVPPACQLAVSGPSANPVQTLSAFSTNPTLEGTIGVTGVNNATTVNQVVPSPASNLAFITYSANTAPTSPAVLPYYIPGKNGAMGTINDVTLAAPTSGPAIIAPLAGAFTPDNSLFFVSTAGDNKIHYISIPTTVSPATPPTDKLQISPNLPACVANGNDLGCTNTGSGTIVPTTAIAVKPRSTT
jgi:hypothetical protein